MTGCEAALLPSTLPAVNFFSAAVTNTTFVFLPALPQPYQTTAVSSVQNVLARLGFFGVAVLERFYVTSLSRTLLVGKSSLWDLFRFLP